MDWISGRMGDKPIQPIIQPVTIDTMLNWITERYFKVKILCRISLCVNKTFESFLAVSHVNSRGQWTVNTYKWCDTQVTSVVSNPIQKGAQSNPVVRKCTLLNPVNSVQMALNNTRLNSTDTFGSYLMDSRTCRRIHITGYREMRASSETIVLKTRMCGWWCDNVMKLVSGLILSWKRTIRIGLSLDSRDNKQHHYCSSLAEISFIWQ